MGYVNRYDATSGALAVTLPALSGLNVGARTMVQKHTTDATGHAVVFNRSGSDQFDDGTTSVTLNHPGDAVTLQVVTISSVKRWKVTESMISPSTIAGISALGAVTFLVDSFGADPTGSTASDTAVAAAITAMGTSPGILEFGVGTYLLNSTKTIAYPGQGIKGQGKRATTIDYRGTGDCLRWWDSTVPTNGLTAPQIGGTFTGLKIDLSNNANSGVVGIHVGDLYAPIINDVWIYGWGTTSSKGLWGENRYTWTERANFNLIVDYCTDDYLFETNASHPLAAGSSWSYSDFWLAFNVIANQNAITLKNKVAMTGVRLTAIGNADPGTTNTGVVLTVGTAGGDTSFLTGEVNLVVESTNPGTTGHKDINLNGTAGIQAYGALDFNAFSSPFIAGSASPTAVWFFGRINCPSLGQMASGQAFSSTVDIGVGRRIRDKNNNTLLDTSATASAVNYMYLINAAAGSAPVIGSAGSDTDVHFDIFTQGAGTVRANFNPVGVKVSVPSTATSTGVVGQWAADSSFFYVCTATNTWRRVAVAAW